MKSDIIHPDANKLAVMKIYDWPTGPYPARVRIALAEKNLQSRVQFETVNLYKGEHKQPAFLAKNYSGTLPVLELDDGTFIAECTAITEYLDALDGVPHAHRQDIARKGLDPHVEQARRVGVARRQSVFISTTAHRGLGPKSRSIRTPNGGSVSATKP
ncbi:MAG: glutathione S-transferase N-terminal domain-containing protein [Acetobacteraceae bacterium]